MIGTSSRTPAMIDRSSAYRPKIGSTSWLRMVRPMNVSDPDREAEDELAPDPLPKIRSTVLMTAQMSNRQLAGRAWSKVATMVVLSLRM